MATIEERGEFDELTRVRTWVILTFIDLGFTEELAELLADARIDHHLADQMLTRGATHDQVVRICL